MKIDNIKVRRITVDGEKTNYMHPYYLYRDGYSVSLNRKYSLLYLRNYFMKLMPKTWISSYVEFSDGSTAILSPSGFTCQLTCNFE